VSSPLILLALPAELLALAVGLLLLRRLSGALRTALGRLAFFQILAVVVALAYFDQRSADKRARMGWDLVPILVVSEDVPAGTVLTANQLRQRQMPSQFLTPGMLRPDSYKMVIGERVRINLTKGDLLLWSEF
jgi:Flp pilus assembly protein CpaB